MTAIIRPHRAVFTPKLSPRVEQIARAYKEAPWQKQRQWIFLFLIGAVAMGMMAGLYLNVTAGATIAGRQIQELEIAITLNERANADLESNLATLLASSVMESRARELGFIEVKSENVEYLLVPGYHAPRPFVVNTILVETETPQISEQFTQSLFDWLNDQMALSVLASK